MEDTEIINLWRSYSKKLDENLFLNRKNAQDITHLKVRSFLTSMRPLKIFTIGVGICWVAFIDWLIIHIYPFASFFFLVSAGLQVLLTKLAIGIYLYQLVLIDQVDVSGPVLATQKKLAGLRSSTLWVTRLLFLQLPLWNTFYWSHKMFEHATALLYVIQIAVTLAFTICAVWLFVNIRYENRNKKWFRLIFSGKEWDPVIRSMELLEQIDEYKQE